MCDGEGRYLSYLLRLWDSKREGEVVWRASLEGADTGERRGFTSLDALFAYLRQQTDAAGEAPAAEVGQSGAGR